MREHARTRGQLYDYIYDELPLAERTRVERHLQACPKCVADLATMKTAVGVVKRGTTHPSEERSNEFWNTFAATVAQRIRRQQHSSHTPLRHRVGSVRTYLALHGRTLVLGGGMLALATLALVVWYRSIPEAPEMLPEALRTHFMSVESDSGRMTQYLRRSRALLVGITNVKLDARRSYDLEVERVASRSLAREARVLKQQPLDARSARLVNDLSKIQIELANLKESDARPNLEIIRSGIEQENLLFKIRMAESAYHSAHFMKTSDR